jgi:carbamate kinase
MGPKVEAALIFAESKTGREAVITALETAGKELLGESRTLIKKS